MIIIKTTANHSCKENTCVGNLLFHEMIYTPLFSKNIFTNFDIVLRKKFNHKNVLFSLVSKATIVFLAYWKASICFLENNIESCINYAYYLGFFRKMFLTFITFLEKSDKWWFAWKVLVSWYFFHFYHFYTTKIKVAKETKGLKKVWKSGRSDKNILKWQKYLYEMSVSTNT